MRKFDISYHIIASWLIDNPRTENDALFAIMINLDCDAGKAQEIFDTLTARLARVRARLIRMNDLKLIIANEFRNKYPEYSGIVTVR